MYDFHDSTDALKFWTEKWAINKTFLFFIWFWWKLVKLYSYVPNGVYTRLLFFSKFCTVYTFDRHYTFNKNLYHFLIFTKFYKIVIKNWNNGMENWSGTYFIHFSSEKSLKSSLYANISLWKIPPICLFGQFQPYTFIFSLEFPKLYVY